MIDKLLKKTSTAVFVYILIFLIPMTIYCFEFMGAGLGLDTLWVIVLFPVFIYICLIRNRVPNLTLIGNLHLLYIFVLAFSSLFAIWKYIALRFTGAYVIEFFLCFIYTIFFLRTREQVEKAVYVFIIIGVLNAIMGWIELGAFALFNEIVYPPFATLFRSTLSLKSFGSGTGSYGIPGYMRMFGFGNEASNFFGTVMMIPFGLIVYCIAKYWNSRIKTFLIFLLMFILITILVSASRSGYLGIFVFSAFAFVFYRSKKAFYPLLTRPLVIVVGILALVIVAYISAIYTDFFLGADKTVTANLSVQTPIALVKRLNPFVKTAGLKTTWWYFESHFVLALKYCFENFGFGMGAGSFDPYIWNLYPVKFGSHSNFILFLGDTGVWGLIIQILIAFFTLRCGLKTYFNQPPEKRDQLPLFLTAIFAGLLAIGVARTFYTAPYTFIVSGLIVKLYLLSVRKCQTGEVHQ